MAIVIDGDGTVTGISVGGLPDGIVDAGTLATNSVDSAELIDGAVDDSHMAAMAASKLTGALPAISGANLTGIESDYKLLSTTTCSNTNNVVITLNSSYPTNKIILSGIVMVNNNDTLRLSVGKGAAGTNYTLAGKSTLNRYVYNSSDSWTTYNYSASGAVTFANDLANAGYQSYNAELVFDEGWFDVTQRCLLRGSSTQIGSSDVLEYTLIAMNWDEDDPNSTNNVKFGGNAGAISEGVIKHYGVK